MKKKLIISIAGFLIFLFCFFASVLVRDYFNEISLRTNIHRIKVGMSEKEVIQILGKPSDKVMSDVPGLYWTYQTNSFNYHDNPDELDHILLEMGSDEKVVKVYDF